VYTQAKRSHTHVQYPVVLVRLAVDNDGNSPTITTKSVRVFKLLKVDNDYAKEDEESFVFNQSLCCCCCHKSIAAAATTTVTTTTITTTTTTKRDF